MSTQSTIPAPSPLSRVACQHCGRERHFRREQLPLPSQALEIQCECGHVYQLVCETRRYVRKPVKLSATLAPLLASRWQAAEAVTVVDISLGGLRLVTLRPDIEVGTRFRVRLLLAPIPNTWFEPEIIVRHVQDGCFIGAEFIEQSHNPDLDLFLMSFQISD